MLIALLFLLVFVILVLYFKSENKFFFLDKKELQIAKQKLIISLQNLDRDDAYIKRSIKSYNWFCENPERYDGSTIVLDLAIIFHKKEKLEVESMNHDYDWIHGANRNFLKCWKSNLVYYKDLRRNGKGRKIGRLIGLTLVSFFFVPVMYVKYMIK